MATPSGLLRFSEVIFAITRGRSQRRRSHPVPDAGAHRAHWDLMLVIVRHAEAEVRDIGGPSEDRRPLTARGRRQADAIVERLASFNPAEIHSSPYERAVATVVPTAQHLGIPIRRWWPLREWDDGLETRKDWKALYDACWCDPGCSYGDGESHAQLITRAKTAIEALLTRAEHHNAIAATHGTWIARAFEGLGIASPYELWTHMPTPAIYQIVRRGKRTTVTGPGLPG
jgi:2,3-bisphosphoglycerate-dependent phosphoglycerate mutase